MFGLEIAMLPIESEKFRDSLSPVTLSPEFWVWGQLQTLVWEFAVLPIELEKFRNSLSSLILSSEVWMWR